MGKERKSRRGVDTNMIRTKGKGIIEDATLNGEFVPSFHAWNTLDEQKERVKYLEEISDGLANDVKVEEKKEKKEKKK